MSPNNKHKTAEYPELRLTRNIGDRKFLIKLPLAAVLGKPQFWVIRLTAVVLFMAVSAQAATRYVAPLSPSCNPSTKGSGTLNDPWTNLFWAMTQGGVQPGDTVQLRGGTYQNSYTAFQAGCNLGIGGVNTVLPLNIAGTQANPIVIENYPGEVVIIDGTDADIAGITWTHCGNNTWTTSTLNVGSAYTSQVWVNPSGPDDPGSRLKWAGTGGCSGLQPGQFSPSAGNTLSVRLPDNSDANNADIHMACQAGDCAFSPINAESGANWITIRKNLSGGSFYLKYGYYSFYADHGAQNIVVDGLNIIAAGGRDYGSCVRVYNGNNITIKNGVCKEAMGEGIQFYGGGPGGSNGNGIQISNNVVQNMDISLTGRGWVDGGGNGNNLGMSIVIKNCNNCAARGNRARDAYGPALVVTNSTNDGVTSNNVTVEGNTLWNFGYNDATQNRDQVGIVFQPQNNTGYTGGTIRNNVIFNSMATHSNPEAGIKVSAGGHPPITGLVIVNNSISNVGGPCIDLQENGAPVTLRNNAMTNCSTKGNVCNGNGRCDLMVESSAHVHDHNAYGATNPGDQVVYVNGGASFTRSNVTGYEPTAVTGSALFTSATDLHLPSGSPLINAGTPSSAPSTDHDGASRPQGGGYDIGAYEFGGVIQPPPTTSACDLNGDSQMNVTDVQLMVNQTLGMVSCTGDINKDGLCNVIDVQRVVNAALGGTCVTQ